MQSSEAQQQLAEMAKALRDLDAQLAALSPRLPCSPCRDQMFESEIPFDVPTEVLGVIDLCRSEFTLPAAEALERAARATDASLLAAFEEAMSRLRAGRASYGLKRSSECA